MMKLTSFVVAGIAIIAGPYWHAAAMTPPAPSKPPSDWQQHVIPGFNPSIESLAVSLQDSGPFDEVAIQAQVDKWGPAAVDALAQLMRDPAWERYRGIYGYMLQSGTSAEYAEKLIALADSIAAQSTRTREEKEIFNTICAALARNELDAARTALLRYSESELPEVQQQALYALTAQGDVATVDKIEARLTSLPKGVQENLKRTIEYRRKHLRAQEPMENVLKKETGAAK